MSLKESLRVTGRVGRGNQVFSRRVSENAAVFGAIGERDLHPGSINVTTDDKRCVAIWPQFAVPGAESGRDDEDLLFEECLLEFEDGRTYSAYRVRPYCVGDGRGGNGDHILEIVAEFIEDIAPGDKVIVTFDRSDRRKLQVKA